MEKISPRANAFRQTTRWNRIAGRWKNWPRLLMQGAILPSEKLRRPWPRDRERTSSGSQHQLHECLQRLLQVLRVLFGRERDEESLRLSFEQLIKSWMNSLPQAEYKS